MSYPHYTRERDSGRSGRRRTRSWWWAVGLAGVTGLALTAMGITGPAANAAGRTLATAEDRTGQPDRPSAEGHRDEGKPDDEGNAKGKGKKEEKGSKGIPVPCDTDKLIAAIVLANARGGAALDLANDCTYLLTADLDGSGLPAITTPIALNGGKDTTIKRAAAADEFRILTVDAGGDLTLKKLKITGGQTTEAAANGGGILVNTGGALTVVHSNIIRNIAGSNGGGVYSTGQVTINKSNIESNVAPDGGGGIASVDGLVQITHSSLSRNSASQSGGGAVLSARGTVRIAHSSLSENQAIQGAGLYIIASGSGAVVGTRFVRNVATEVGGGIFVLGQLTMQESALVDNTAGLAGAGLFIVLGSAVSVDDSSIKNNISIQANGGGILNSGETVIRNTKITGNQANLGGGIYNESSGVLTLFATKIINNIATSDGGGIFNVAGGTVELNAATGTVVIKNRPNNCTGDVSGCAG
ncbi:autotransporter outer membrane beta-barrel domain-containing protein [Salinispora fenicalii]|uniref:right-handed parallel beta-helix repeat-containing protein n=1 Tax=Salinispora fenicalii TaxID=1137263 RepID=UPI000481EB92|nr:right-handed parallel beta-helix repeat-containing protein [Salinispora fenicalii]